jgi:hypothetical protein
MNITITAKKVKMKPKYVTKEMKGRTLSPRSTSMAAAAVLKKLASLHALLTLL